MTRDRAVLGVATVGVALPYLARLPGCVLKGSNWLGQYLDAGLQGALLVEGFNLFAALAAIGVTALLHRRGVWILPVLAGYGFLAYAHGSLDLRSDAQAAVALVFIPLFSLPFFAVGATLGAVARWAIDVEARERGAK